MKMQKPIGWLLIIGALGVFIPYTMLTIIFEYPDILRQDTSVILTKFHNGGSRLIGTWFAFALLGLPLIPAYLMLGQAFENKNGWIRTATTIGVIGLLVQMIGLLRWTFVIPVLASSFVNSTDDATKAATIASFKLIHQFGGVLLGEHIGQLFTIIWTIIISISLVQLKYFPKWMGWFGVISSVIYLMSQAELLATVIPDFPLWDLSGFIGSTLWLIWLLVFGIRFVKGKELGKAGNLSMNNAN